MRRAARIIGEMPGKVYIGTSGWIYKSWAKTFYPDEVKGTRLLAFYAQNFPTVEINATFYRLPETKTFRGWRERAPRGFIYAVKGSRAVTHFKKLLPGAKSYDLFLERVVDLGGHRGPVLWQLPGSFKKNAQRLEDFCKGLPKSLLHAIEFRDPSWLDEEILEILRRHKIGSVSLSSETMPMNLEVTAGFVYVRFHGLAGGAAHDYTRAELEPWAEHLRKCSREGLDAYVYFNNDINVRAPGNAKMLMEMVGASAVRPLAAPQQN